MYLKKYTTADFPTLQSWVTDADLLFKFAGNGWEFPLSSEQIHSYMQANPLRHYLLAYNLENVPVAYGEIINGDEHSPRLGRLLIGTQDNRGKGLGTQFINLLINECKKLYDTDSLFLFVLEDNYRAIRCYEK